MNPWLKKFAAFAFLLFVVLWVAGVIRSYTLSPEQWTIVPEPTLPVLSAIEDYRASQKVANNLKQAHNLKQIGLIHIPLPKILEQANVDKIKVHEKTAQLSLGSIAFTDDEEQIRKTVAAHKAVVFHEKASGLAPRRVLVLGIAVHPDRFDALLEELTAVAQLQSINVQQQDRTSEFRRLHTQRQSLQKQQEAILKLRGAAKSSVEDVLKVEQRILELEKEIQSVSLQLGDFLDAEPSYNLFVTLQEYRPGSWHDRTPTLMKRIQSGFFWALGWWAVTVGGLAIVVVTGVSVLTLLSRRD